LVSGNNTIAVPVYIFGGALVGNFVYHKATPHTGRAPIQRPSRQAPRIPISTKPPLSWLNNVIGLRGGVAQARTFERKVRNYCRQRGVNPNHLMSLMALETGRSFEPKQANMQKYKEAGKWKDADIKEKYLNALMKAPNGHPEEVEYPNTYPYAFGLIQFTSIAAILIGRTLWEIYNADLNQQFEFVKMYLDKQGLGTKYKNSDQYTLYMLIFAPSKANVGKNDTVYAVGSTAYKKNKSLDTDGRNGITKKEIAHRVDRHINEGKYHAKTLL